ncbi:MAG TPA: hypothetical protein VJI69_02465, partial [Bacteroidia bacterium]|nr:hypothetical protein [Bacteroidia bacterium]
IIFLALIRCISEPFRLQYYSETTLSMSDIKPFLIGSLIAAIALFTMNIFSVYGKHKIIVVISILCICLLVAVKIIYAIP